MADLEAIRRQSKSDGEIIDLGDGELRGGGYCLAPPSKHPNGHVYRWLIAPGDEIPTIDLHEAGFLPVVSELYTEDTDHTEDTDDIGSLCTLESSVLSVSQARSRPASATSTTGISGRRGTCQ
jgi:hypothetical protein